MLSVCYYPFMCLQNRWKNKDGEREGVPVRHVDQEKRDCLRHEPGLRVKCGEEGVIWRQCRNWWSLRGVRDVGEFCETESRGSEPSWKSHGCTLHFPNWTSTYTLPGEGTRSSASYLGWDFNSLSIHSPSLLLNRVNASDSNSIYFVLFSMQPDLLCLFIFWAGKQSLNISSPTSAILTQ